MSCRLSLAKGVTIRPLEASDAPQMARLANNWNIVKWMRNSFPYPYDEAAATNFIGFTEQTAQWAPRKLASVPTSLPAAEAGQLVRTMYAICLEDQGIVGSIGLRHRQDVEERNMELGYWVAESAWGRGVGRVAVVGFVEWAWTAWPWMQRIEAGVFSGNPASDAVLRKAGFEREGVLRRKVWKAGKTHDQHVWACLKPESAESSNE